MSLDQYYGASTNASARKYTVLTTSPAVTFASTRMSLHDHLTAILTPPSGISVHPTPHQEMSEAVLLGLWLADGFSREATIAQGGSPGGHKHCHWEVFTFLMEDYGGRDVHTGVDIQEPLFPFRAGNVERVTMVFHRTSSAGYPVYNFHFDRVNSVFAQVLRRYNLVNNKHIPADILCDTIDVRRRVVAGLMDGDGHYTQHNCYAVSAKHRVQVDGYRDLARSLGVRAGHRLPTRCTNEETGQVYSGFSVVLSGAMWECSQFCVLRYKRAKQPVTSASWSGRLDHGVTASLAAPHRLLASASASPSTLSPPYLCPTTPASFNDVYPTDTSWPRTTLSSAEFKSARLLCTPHSSRLIKPIFLHLPCPPPPSHRCLLTCTSPLSPVSCVLTSRTQRTAHTRSLRRWRREAR